ncbi:MAG: sulfatase [Phycisphaerae bacterium]
MLRAILLVVIDCLRADHVSCYGYDRPTTPTLDALAERGVLWKNAYSTACWTKPAVASLFTGLYPTQHGAFQGIKRSRLRESVTTDVLGDSHATLAEVLTRAGWRCGAFINNAQLGEFTGLQRGFATYVPNAGQADRLIGRFSDWLEAGGGRPSFAYLHFLEAHWPYKPRRRHVAMFGGNRDTNKFRDYRARDYARLRRAIVRGERALSDDELRQMIQLYDGAIRRLDGKLKTILGRLRELGLGEDAAVIVTADHGEEFMEHGRIGHGQSLLYDEVMHVPLVAHVPGGPRGVQRRELVSQVDLAETVASIAGLNGELPGQNLLDPVAKPRPVCAEMRIRHKYTQCIRTARWKLYRRYVLNCNDADARSSRSPRDLVGTCSYQLTHELYDMDADPQEHVNMAEKPACAAARAGLEADLDQWWQGLPLRGNHRSPGEVQIDDAVVQRLRDLGYLD